MMQCSSLHIARLGFASIGRRYYTPLAVRFGLKELPPPASYGGRHTVTMFPGDGIGPEMMSHVREVCRVMAAPIDFEVIQLDALREDKQSWQSGLISVLRNGIAIKGNIEDRSNDPSIKSRNGDLRTRLDLFANIVRIKSIPGIRARHENVDCILIRENVEGEYQQIEHESVDGVVESLKIVTRANSRRLAKFAFDYAVANNRKKVTAVHKANIMKLGDGLFLECCREEAENYPGIEFESMIVDNCSMQMASNPTQFDVMILPNLYGAILANIGCGVIGGPGLVSGVNIGTDIAVFETGTRNTGKSIVGRNTANPVTWFRAAADMLSYLKMDAVRSAVFIKYYLVKLTHFSK